MQEKTSERDDNACPDDHLKESELIVERKKRSVSQRVMRTRAHDIIIAVPEFKTIAEEWIDDAGCRQHSAQTIASRRLITGKFIWWAKDAGHTDIGAKEIRAFLAYVGAPAPPGGRWGNPHETKKNQPRTVHTYWERLRTLFLWAEEQELIEASPMSAIKPPVARRDQVQPFTKAQIAALLSAAERTRYPLRDAAICLLLLDSGVRSSELCGLRVTDLDLANCQGTVLGKGHKRRSIYFDVATKEALAKYLASGKRRPDDTVFHGERGSSLTRSGLQQMIERLGRAAGITGVRCSPHTFRHTAAIWSVRAGMNAFALQGMLGHTDLQMTRRYVAIAQADLEEQHRRYSPVRHLSAR